VPVGELGECVHEAGAVFGSGGQVAANEAAVLREVHRSDMSKLGSDGKPLIRDDGKVLKSEKYFPPDIESVLSLQATAVSRS
jgi:predicted HAD superfamily Cof-like phosphohydrolase